MSNSSDTRSSSESGQLAEPLLVEQRQRADPHARLVQRGGLRDDSRIARAQRGRARSRWPSSRAPARRAASTAPPWARPRRASWPRPAPPAAPGWPSSSSRERDAPRRATTTSTTRSRCSPRCAPAVRERDAEQVPRDQQQRRAEHDEAGQQGVADEQLDDGDRRAPPPTRRDDRRRDRLAPGPRAARAGRRRSWRGSASRGRRASTPAEPDRCCAVRSARCSGRGPWPSPRTIATVPT